MLKLYNQNRKVIAILFALFLLISIVFLGLIGNKVIQLEEEIGQAEVDYERSLHKYLQSTFDILFQYSNVIKYGWETSIQYQGHLEEEEFVQSFIDNVIIPEKMTGEYFIFIVYDNGEDQELLYKGYDNEKYEDLILPIKPNYSIDYQQIFGEDNKFFYLTTDLKHNDINLQVHIGFLEDVIYDGYIQTTELDSIIAFREYAESILMLISIFMLLVAILGTYSLYKTLKLINNDLTTNDYWNLYVLSEFIQSDEGIKNYLNKVLKEEDVPSIDKLLKRLEELIEMKRWNDNE